MYNGKRRDKMVSAWTMVPLFLKNQLKGAPHPNHTFDIIKGDEGI